MAIYNFPDHINGDTFEGVEITININGSALNLDGASVVMTVTTDNNAEFEFSTANGKLEIVAPVATTGKIKFKKQVVSFPSQHGTFNYEIVYTLADGTIKTYVHGTWKITEY